VIVLVIAGIAAGVPESPVRTPGRIDVLGALLLSAGLVALLLGVDRGGQWGWSAGRTLGLFAGAVVALTAWVAAELKVSRPLVDMRMLRIRGVWAPNVVGLAFGFVLFGSFLLIPQLLELPAATGYGFGKDVTQAGLFLLPLTAAQLVFGPVSGILEGRLGARVPLLLGSILGVVAYVVPAISHAASWLLLLSGALSGIGIGLAQAAMTNATIESVPPVADRHRHQPQRHRPHHRRQSRLSRSRRDPDQPRRPARHPRRGRLHHRILDLRRGRRRRRPGRPGTAPPPDRGVTSRIFHTAVLFRVHCGQREPGQSQRRCAEGASRPRARARSTASPRPCVPSLV
jgi:hypothetical protein